jgi:hypothetical protein
MAMRHDKFAVFILTHGRPNKVYTIKTLRDSGYTGDIYLILDDEDTTLENYITNYSKQVKDFIIFNKNESAKNFDIGDNITNKKVVVFARNMCHKMAKDLNLDYFLELDDDYININHRYYGEDKKKLYSTPVKSFDDIFDLYLDFLDSADIKTVAFAQGGELIGGVGSDMFKKGIKRKAMNAFFCRTDRPFQFKGRINEDVNMYVDLGNRGELVFTLPFISVVQKETQQNSGGLTEFYLDTGTYYKSFITCMYSPSNVKIAAMGESSRRIHHQIQWNNTTPMIISPDYKKR